MKIETTDIPPDPQRRGGKQSKYEHILKAVQDNPGRAIAVSELNGVLPASLRIVLMQLAKHRHLKIHTRVQGDCVYVWMGENQQGE